MSDALRAEIKAIFQKADAALAAGTITKTERDAFLVHKYGSADLDKAIARTIPKEEKTHDPVLLVTAFTFLMVSLFGILLYTTGGITGAVVLESMDISTTYTQDAIIPLTLDGATRITIEGMASGVGDITTTLDVGGTTYALHSYRMGAASTEHASLPARWYAEGQPVTLTQTGADSVYLMTPEQAIQLDASQAEITIEGLAQGEYEFVLLINGTTIAEERLAFTVGPAGGAPSELVSACGEACDVNLTGEATLSITFAGDASLLLDRIVVRTGGNSAPILAAQIPDITAADSVQLDLVPVFTDPDGDTLFYSSSNHAGMTETITDGVLTIAGPPGTYTYIAYASDMRELIQSNMFVITLTGAVVEPNVTMNETPVNETVVNVTDLNETSINVTDLNASDIANTTIDLNVTPPDLNGTVDLNTTIDSNITLNLTLDCSAPDPNERPVDCLTLEAETYFEEDVYLENVGRAHVARITPIGNMLLQGGVIQYDIGSPSPGDFTIGYRDGDFEYQAVAWIDGGGTLHLRGRLIEENNQLTPPEGSYTIINRRGVYLAYADLGTGDLYLRGNLIPYRVTIG